MSYTHNKEINQICTQVINETKRFFNKDIITIENYRNSGVLILEFKNESSMESTTLCYEESRDWIVITNYGVSKLPIENIGSLITVRSQKSYILAKTKDLIVNNIVSWLTRSQSEIIKANWQYYTGQKLDDRDKNILYLCVPRSHSIYASYGVIIHTVYLQDHTNILIANNTIKPSGNILIMNSKQVIDGGIPYTTGNFFKVGQLKNILNITDIELSEIAKLSQETYSGKETKD